MALFGKGVATLMALYIHTFYKMISCGFFGITGGHETWSYRYERKFFRLWDRLPYRSIILNVKVKNTCLKRLKN